MSLYELHDPGVALISATLTDDQSLDEVKRIIIETISTLAREGPANEELDRAKTRLIQAADRTMANSQQLAMLMTSVIASGDWRLLFTNYEALKRVTAEDVVRVAKLYFKDSNRTVGFFVPDSVPDRTVVPSAPGIDELLTSYTPDISIESGEALDPSPAALEKRIRRSTVGGFRLALLPKSSRGARVQASLIIRFGDDQSLIGQDAASRLTQALLMRGTRTKDRQQLQDAMQQLNANINLGGGLASVTATISTTAENLSSALRLAVEILREPAFPESDFDQIQKQQVAQADRGRTQPSVLVTRMQQAALSPFPRTDVRHIRTIDEEIEDLGRVTLDDVKSFHRRFYGASHGQLVVVGSFDAVSIEKTAVDLLSSWKSASPYEGIVTKYKKADPINTKIETPDKENAQFSAGLHFRMREADPDYPAMLLANFMFGGGITSRLPDRVRNREGLSYTVFSSFAAPVEGDAAAFSVSAIANPANMPKVEASFSDELMKTLRDGFTAAEVASAKKAIRDTRVRGRSSDNEILNLISLREQYARTLAWDQELDARLEALTVDQINAAFRRHVKPGEISIVKGGDFAAAKAYR